MPWRRGQRLPKYYNTSPFVTVKNLSFCVVKVVANIGINNVNILSSGALLLGELGLEDLVNSFLNIIIQALL